MFNILDIKSFSTEDIIVSTAMGTDEFLDTNINKTYVSRHYKFKKEDSVQKVTLFQNFSSKEYEAKYFLQDIAYEYRLKNKKRDDLLLFLEEIEEEGLQKLRLLAISTFGCFDSNLCVDVKIDFESDGSISKRGQFKIKNILNNADFTCDRVVVFSRKNFPFVDEILKGSRLRITEIVYLTDKEIFRFFKGVKPFVKSKALLRYLVSVTAGFIGLMFILNFMFDSEDSALKDLHDNVMKNHDTNILAKKSEYKKVLKMQEQLFLDTTRTMRPFVPGKDSL